MKWVLPLVLFALPAFAGAEEARALISLYEERFEVTNDLPAVRAAAAKFSLSIQLKLELAVALNDVGLPAEAEQFFAYAVERELVGEVPRTQWLGPTKVFMEHFTALAETTFLSLAEMDAALAAIVPKFPGKPHRRTRETLENVRAQLAASPGQCDSRLLGGI